MDKKLSLRAEMTSKSSAFNNISNRQASFANKYPIYPLPPAECTRSLIPVKVNSSSQPKSLSTKEANGFMVNGQCENIGEAKNVLSQPSSQNSAVANIPATVDIIPGSKGKVNKVRSRPFSKNSTAVENHSKSSAKVPKLLPLNAEPGTPKASTLKQTKPETPKTSSQKDQVSSKSLRPVPKLLPRNAKPGAPPKKALTPRQAKPVTPKASTLAAATSTSGFSFSIKNQGSDLVELNYTKFM